MTAVDFNIQLLSLEKKLMIFANSLTFNKEIAKDLVQDTMLKAITFREQFHNDTNLKAWTYTILKNTFINNYRKSTRQHTVFDNTSNLFFLSNTLEGRNVNAESIYSAKEIQKIIDNLSDELRIPFKMHVEGYKYKEIAEKLNLNIGTVKSRIFFSRKKLMDLLETNQV
jgi:RNA polymerase sigma-70 factor (ECF subfamily)